MVGDTIFYIILYISYGLNIISFFLFVFLIIVYSSKKTKKGFLVFCQIHILVLAFILCICNIVGIYFSTQKYPKIPTTIQAYVRLFCHSGIETTQLGIISLNLISFQFSVFMSKHPKICKLIVLLIIYFPILIYILPEIIITLIKELYILCNEIGICFSCWTLNHQFILDSLFGGVFILILISLHCLIKRYFKQHTDNTDKPYSSQLKGYYIALGFTFPTIIGIILEKLLAMSTSPNEVLYYIVICLQTLILEIFPLIISLIYCFNWLLITNFFWSKKKIIEQDEKIVEILLSST